MSNWAYKANRSKESNVKISFNEFGAIFNTGAAGSLWR